MPELPEVETMKRDLAQHIQGLRIKDVFVFDDRVLKDISAKSFARKLKGTKIKALSRRGKAILFTLDPKLYIVVQVKMTGFFVYGEKSGSRDTKVIFQLSNGKYLNYNDQRLFGWFHVVKDLQKVKYLQTIGPEPLTSDFQPQWLRQHLKRRTSPIKTLLMNQHFVAGIGNIYASEILFSSKINPKKRANRLTHKEIQNLHQSTVTILDEAIKYRGTSMRNYRDSKGEKGNFMNRIKVYGRDKESCLECGTSITRIVQAGRSTFYCKRCQK